MALDRVEFEDMLREMLLSNEGLTLEAYKCNSGKWTIGIGFNLEGDLLSEHEALQLKIEDGEMYKKYKSREFEGLKFSRSLVSKMFQRQLDGVINEAEYLGFIENDGFKLVACDMLFNLGFAGFKKFKLFMTYALLKDVKRSVKEIEDSLYYTQVKDRAKRNIKLIKKKL